MSVTTGSDSGPGSLRQAIIDAPDGSIITISPMLVAPIVLNSPITFSKNLDIVAYTDQVITVSAGFVGQYAITCTNRSVTFERIIFQGNPAVLNTGAVYLNSNARTNNSALTLNYCTATGWTTTTQSSAQASASDLYLESCVFTNNIGGSAALSAIPTAGMSLNLSQFAGNAALYNIVVNNCQFVDNEGEEGAGLTILPTSNSPATTPITNTTITNSQFINNVATIAPAVAINPIAGIRLGLSASNTLGGPLIIENCLFENNVSTQHSGVHVAGSNTISSTIKSCIFRNNTSSDETGTSGLSWINRGTNPLTIENCIFDSNANVSSGALNLNRGFDNNFTNPINILNTSIINNVSIGASGTVTNPSVGGLSLQRYSGALEMVNCTIDNNRGGRVGGMAISLGDLSSISSTLTFRNVSITNNIGPVTGGLSTITGATTILFNTLIADNFSTIARTTRTDVTGPISSASFNNLISMGVGLTGITNGTQGNQIGTAVSPIDPLLGPQGDYGGSNNLPVVPLLEGSPAIDAGGNVYVVSTYDERGSPYLRIWSEFGPATVDIGAFEFQPFVLPCYAGESILKVRELKSGEVKHIQAKDIYADEHEVYDLDQGYFIPVKYNAVMRGATVVYKITKDLLGENKPSEDLFITSGHPIDIDGKAVKARNVPGAERTDIDKVEIYSIVCKRWTPIDVNGIGVYAWSEHKWFDHVKKEGIVWVDNKRAE